MAQTFLSLGTNLGDRPANLAAARAALPPAVHIQAASPVYETPPWGVTGQPAFLNQVLQAETSLPPLELLYYIKSIERRLGRTPTYRNGPRLIDLDILFYEDWVIELPGLQIPHPRAPERAFVLVPLADLAPGWVHPLTGESVQAMLDKLDRDGIKKYPDHG